jgi:hypothetical protein
VKHLDPSLLAALADGASAGTDADAHLRACAQCRAELTALRGLCGDLAQAPAPNPELRQATLQRLGLRPRREAGSSLPRWAWAPALGAALLAWALIPQADGITPEAPTVASLPSKPAPAAKAAERKASRPSSTRAALRPAPTGMDLEQAAQSDAPAIGQAATDVEAAQTRIIDAPLKAEPTPLPPSLQVQVRNNMIRNGEILALTVELPAAGSFSAQVFDGRGRLVETLYQGPAGPGSVILHWDAAGVPSAVYTVLLKSGAQSKKVKAVVAR